jgi:hypothetical protein
MVHGPGSEASSAAAWADLHHVRPLNGPSALSTSRDRVLLLVDAVYSFTSNIGRSFPAPRLPSAFASIVADFSRGPDAAYPAQIMNNIG